MGYSKEYFAQELGKRFPEFHGAYEEHLEYYEELLGHVFFGGETLLGVLESLLKTNEEKEKSAGIWTFWRTCTPTGTMMCRTSWGHHPGRTWGRRDGACATPSPTSPRTDAGLPVH